MEKYEGGEFELMKDESGFPSRAAGECVWEKVRRARGAIVRDTRAGRVAPARPEAVEAIRRVRDAIVWIARWLRQLEAPHASSRWSEVEEAGVVT